MMKKVFFLLAVAMIFFQACVSDLKDREDAVQSKMGGTFKINETAPFQTLYPPSAKDIVSSHLISQIYEGLVKYDPNNLSIVPAIAKRWEIDTSGTRYTFHLDTAVCFHDNECFQNGIGRKVTARDFKYSFELLATQSEDNLRFNGTIDRILGAKAYYAAGNEAKPEGGIEGIRVINDSTLEITIEEPNSIYIYLLADISAVVIPKEGVEKYGNKNYVGSGPFGMTGYPDRIGAIYLIRNKKYHKFDKDSIRLPYLDSVKVSFVPTTVKELNMLQTGKLDIVTGLTEQYISEFLQKNITKFESNPPELIIDGSEDFAAYELYNIRSSWVNNFASNRMNIMDLSVVYKMRPKVMTPEELKKAKQM